MSKSGAKLIEAAKEAVAIAKGEQPAARIHVNGHAYVPASELDRLTLYETALRKLQNAAAAYVHPQHRISAEELIDLLLATVDDRELFRALRGDETPPDPERNTMAWMERCFPDLAADVRSGKSSFSEAHLEAVRRSLNATSEL